MLGASWRTSTGGLSAMLVAVGVILKQVVAAIDGDPSTVANVDAAIVAAGVIANGLGLWNARDDKVSSEQAQAKP